MAASSDQCPPSSDKIPPVVLIAVDASKKAEHAVNFYMNNLHKAGNCVVFINIVELPTDAMDARRVYMTPSTLAEVWRQEEEKSKMLEAKYIQLMKDRGVDDAKFRLEGGLKPGHVIVQIANDIGATMVLMGTRGMGTVRRTILGSVSDYVVHHAHCPVIVCRMQKEQHQDHN